MGATASRTEKRGRHESSRVATASSVVSRRAKQRVSGVWGRTERLDAVSGASSRESRVLLPRDRDKLQVLVTSGPPTTRLTGRTCRPIPVPPMLARHNCCTMARTLFISTLQPLAVVDGVAMENRKIMSIEASRVCKVVTLALDIYGIVVQYLEIRDSCIISFPSHQNFPGLITAHRNSPPSHASQTLAGHTPLLHCRRSWFASAISTARSSISA
jgi:hypothetical protein